MKTYEQLMTHYWGVIVPMAEAAGIYPWLCVTAFKGDIFDDHPLFNCDPGCYTFALTILQDETGRGKPVFVGDKLYANNCAEPLTIKGLSTIRGNLFVGECMNYDIGILSWTPPTPKVTPKKRTFMLNGKELNSPVNKGKGDYLTRVAGNEFYFTNYDDRNALDNILYELLTIARDKEE